MKNILAAVVLFLIPITVAAQTDCKDAIIVCGDNNYTGLNATGIGIQELNINNACTSVEHNSLWLKVLIKDGGTLGFIITPEEIDDLVVDFDFWMYGPGVDCDNLGTAIRCSTTNPLAAGLTYNTTGMNEEATDTSEGPNEDGNAFINWVDAQDDDIYYLVIDRPHGASNFSLQWTGTATFHDIPLFLNPDNIPLNIAQCDADGTDDDATAFDLTIYSAMFIGPQTDIALTYHLSLNDMTTGENPIATPQAYNNVSNPQTIYLRMTNTMTGCFSNETFSISVEEALLAGTPANLSLCDYNDNGIQLFDLWENNALVTNGDTNINVTYYASQEDADNRANALNRYHPNSQPYTTETIWARFEYIVGCFGYGLAPFTINVTPPLDFSYTLDVIDFKDNDSNAIHVDMNTGNAAFEFSLDGINFSDESDFNGLRPGIYTVYIRGKDDCKVIDFEVPILSYPRFFTPNGDSYNELWNVKFVSYFPNARITIFDRFGKLIKSYFGSQMGWDGTFNDRRLPATDYWFTLEFANGRTVKGHFSLIR